MIAAATLWLVASPFLVGAAVGHWRPANRFVARYYVPALVVGWVGVGALLAAVFVCDGRERKLAGLAGAPLAGLSFWSRRGGGGDDGEDGPDDDPRPHGGLDWEEFARDFGAYVAARERHPATV